VFVVNISNIDAFRRRLGRDPSGDAEEFASGGGGQDSKHCQLSWRGGPGAARVYHVAHIVTGAAVLLSEEIL